MVLSILCVSLIWFSGGNKILHADTLPNDLGKAVTEIENLDEMRSHLASFWNQPQTNQLQILLNKCVNQWV